MAKVTTATRSKSIEFKFYAPAARKVSIAGSFNSWDSKRTFARKDTRGNWIAKVPLKPGRYEYKFVVDGNWVNDPSCNWCVSNNFGTQNCVIEVR